MTSSKQIQANRENAKKSTGPRTEAGKARSRRNAWKHGLTAETLIIPGEDAADFNELRASLIEQLEPETQLEAEFGGANSGAAVAHPPRSILRGCYPRRPRSSGGGAVRSSVA